VSSHTRGRLTITERLIAVTRLPYWLGCLAISLLTGPPTFFLISFLVTGNIYSAFYLTTSRSTFTITKLGEKLPVPQGLGLLVSYTLLYFVVLMLPRWWRLNLEAKRSELVDLSRDGSKGFERCFGLISSLPGALLGTLGVGIYYVVPRLSLSASVFNIYSTVWAITNLFFFGVGFWVYIAVMWGAFRLTKGKLNLKAYYEDPMFGLKPVGSLTISTASRFFIVVVVAMSGAFLATDPINFAVLLGIFSTATIAAFLPLYRTHLVMQSQKKEQSVLIQRKINEVINQNDKISSLKDQENLDRMRKIMQVQLEKDEVSKIQTWPVEARVGESFIAIIVTILAAILGRILEIILV